MSKNGANQLMQKPNRTSLEIYRRIMIGRICVVSGFLCNDTILEDNVTFHGKIIHRFLDRQVGIPEPSPRICKGAFVGFNSSIIGPVTIGENAVIKTMEKLWNLLLPLQ